MDLKTYLSAAPRGRAAALARAIWVKSVMLSQWAKGQKPVPADRCVALETATFGEVHRKDLRPDDWHRFWPELTPKRATRD